MGRAYRPTVETVRSHQATHRTLPLLAGKVAFVAALVLALALIALILRPPLAFAENSAADDSSALDQPSALATAQAQASDTPTSAADAQNLVQVVAPDGTTTLYSSLADAVAAAPADSTVNLLLDQEVEGGSLSLTKGITLNGNGHTLTVHKSGLVLYGSDDDTPAAYTLKHITIKNDNGGCVFAYTGYKTLALEDAVLDAGGTGNVQALTFGGDTPETTEVKIIASTITAPAAGYGIITFNPVDMTIADSQISGYAALYMKGPDSSAGSSGSKVTISEGSQLSSQGIAGPTNSFGTIVLQQCDDVTIDVTDSTITTTAADDASDEPAYQAVVLYSTNGYDNGTMAKNNTVTFGEGSQVTAKGANSLLTSLNGEPNTLKAEGGTYNIEGSVVAIPDASVDPAKTITVTGGNWNQDVSGLAPEGYVAMDSGDSEVPFTIGKQTTEPSSTGDSTETDPTDHTPATHDNQSNTTEPTDNSTTTDTPDTSEVTDTTEDNAAEHNGATNDTDTSESAGTSGTTTRIHHATTPSSRTNTSNRYAAFPQTDDDNPLLPFALGAASTSLIVIIALLIYRRRAHMMH